MSFMASARVPTENASKFLQQVCKHWEHNLAVSFDKTRGQITFPKDARGAEWPGDAVVTLTAEAGTLVCTIAASAEGQRDGLKGAVERHVNRFAFREAPLAYEWINA